jgi:hypothetical protein
VRRAGVNAVRVRVGYCGGLSWIRWWTPGSVKRAHLSDYELSKDSDLSVATVKWLVPVAARTEG